MQDLVYVAAFVAFFVLAGLFVFACDKLIGSDEAALAQGPSVTPEPEFFRDEVAA